MVVRVAVTREADVVLFNVVVLCQQHSVSAERYCSFIHGGNDVRLYNKGAKTHA